MIMMWNMMISVGKGENNIYYDICGYIKVVLR